jgi:hypothetical protein
MADQKHDRPVGAQGYEQEEQEYLGAQGAAEGVTAEQRSTIPATARHTPGPWRVRTQSHEWFCETNHANRVVSDNHPTHFVASIEGFGDDAVANAHLIAAAPEMYAALKAVVADRHACEVMRCRAKAAIARAEGRG